MARHTNQEVINNFLNQKPAKAGALTTDGQPIFLWAYHRQVVWGQTLCVRLHYYWRCVRVYDNIATRWTRKKISYQ